METFIEAEQGVDLIWQSALLDVRMQALEDLAQAGIAGAVFLRYERIAAGVAFLDALDARARKQRFAVARVAVFEARAFDTLDGLVRAVARAVTGAGVPAGQRGIVPFLDSFLAKYGSGALARFDAAMADCYAAGDLLALARAYIESSRRSNRDAARIEAWLNGTSVSRTEATPVALAPLSLQTAKRALAEISVLARVLGYRGTLLVFEGAEMLTRLTPARRASAYTVLRELVDNADGGRGLVAAQIVVAGTPPLFKGPRSLTSLTPLWMRVQTPRDAPPGVPPPHRPFVDLTPPTEWTGTNHARDRRSLSEPSAIDLRAVIRAAQGLPAVDPSVSMSVGHERVDATVSDLFEHSAARGSVFVPLVGAYGSGKTHLLLHLSARALRDRRPVFRLSLERLDNDLGHPPRHLRRLLSQATLPLPGGPSPLDRLVAWTRSVPQTQQLLDTLEAIGSEQSDAAVAAQQAVRLATAKGARAGAALEAYLGGGSLASKAGGPNYRHDAYSRLLLWLALLERLEGCGGPVLLVDEAENLYRGGATRAERKTALRSLAFYCGGTLPGACVVLAITPNALQELKNEAGELLAELAAQRTTLAWEDAEMFGRRLRATKAIETPALTPDLRTVLAFRLQSAHANVRGRVPDQSWASYVTMLVDNASDSREAVRRVIDRLERLWWRGV